MPEYVYKCVIYLFIHLFYCFFAKMLKLSSAGASPTESIDLWRLGTTTPGTVFLQNDFPTILIVAGFRRAKLRMNIVR